MLVLVLVATIATAAALRRRYRAACHLLAGVAPDMRNPLLPLLASDVTERSLPFNRAVLRIPTPVGRGMTSRCCVVPGVGVPVRVIAAAGCTGQRPGVLWLHGGGMVCGSAGFEAASAAATARALNTIVVAPDYRLAPENPFPAPLDDCMATLAWMRKAEFGIDAERIAVVGSSAGGGLAAAVAQRAHDEKLPLSAQVLGCPMIDDRTALRDPGIRGRLVWTAGSNEFGWTAYLGRKPRMSDAPEYAAPARR
ncbi:hypothetical protein MUNTM_49370 [Mycobacterium sp. MUNTM1]